MTEKSAKEQRREYEALMHENYGNEKLSRSAVDMFKSEAIMYKNGSERDRLLGHAEQCIREAKEYHHSAEFYAGLLRKMDSGDSEDFL